MHGDYCTAAIGQLHGFKKKTKQNFGHHPHTSQVTFHPDSEIFKNCSCRMDTLSEKGIKAGTES